MDANIIFRKTHKGLEEIERRIYRLTPRERLLLIQVDGKRSLAALAGKAGLEQEGLDTANKLLSAGFIELIPGIPAQPAGLSARQPALLGGSVPVPRPAVPPPQQNPSPHKTAPVPRPSPAHAAALGSSPTLAPRAAIPQPPAAPRSVQEPAADPRSERRPANWLSSTVAHLTNLFSGGDMEPEVPARKASPTTPAHQRPTERNHHENLAATMAHEPVIDLTAGAEPRFAARPATAEPRPAPAPARQVAARQGHQTTADESLRTRAAFHEPVVDLTDPSDLLWGDEFPADLLPPEIAPTSPTPNRPPPAPATGLSARPPSGPGTQRVAPSAVQAAALPDPDICAQRGTCPGCPRCPGNSVSMARNFMKENLTRLSGKATSSLTQVLDQCRTLAELQRQFEPWLRDLLLTTEGVMEAPNLAGKLQRMLLQ